MSFWGWGLPISDPFLTTTSFIHSGWAVWESWGLLDWWRGALGWAGQLGCHQHMIGIAVAAGCLERSCVFAPKARSIFPVFVFPVAVSWQHWGKKSIQHWESESCLGKGPFSSWENPPLSPFQCGNPVLSLTHTSPASHFSPLPGAKRSSGWSQLLWCCICRSTQDMKSHDPYNSPKQCHHQEAGTVFAPGSPALCSWILFSRSLCRWFLSGACPCVCT